jgi:acyl-coenzyme A thioesterase PaaI-like protein
MNPHRFPSPDVSESFKTRLLRWRFNLFPAFLGTGGHIERIARDFRYVRICIPLTWRTRNYVGTIFGGSIYGAVDPVYMIMFIMILGSGYRIWDKAANIQFRKPARTKLKAEFRISQQEIEDILVFLQTGPKLNRSYTVELFDMDGEVCAVVEKTLYFSKSIQAGSGRQE